jgi:hypothetical protein
LVLVPVVFLLPLVDELIGKFQFDRLCDEAKNIGWTFGKPLPGWRRVAYFS